MNEQRGEQRKDTLTSEQTVPASTGIGGAALAATGAAVGGVSAFAAGAAAGSAAGPIGAAIGGAIGALIGVTVERNLQRGNPREFQTGGPRADSPDANPRMDGPPQNAISDPKPHQTNIRQLSSHQQAALLELVVLAVYADGHVATAEEKRVQRLLALIAPDSDYDLKRRYDEAVAQARKNLVSAEAAQARVAELTTSFPRPGEKQLVREVLQDFVGSDGRISDQEAALLSAVPRVTT